MPDGSAYATRGIETRLLDALDQRPVVVLEGARAVGKSRTAGELVRRGRLAHRVSLDDPLAQSLAARDLRGWLETLPRRTVIDEAQMLPGLSLAVKDLVDRRGGAGHFVLTGSASISRTELDGSDPLAGRAIRLRLQPLTQWEIRRAQMLSSPRQPGAWNIVDRLFDDDFALPRPSMMTDRGQLLRAMERGGFPLSALAATGTARVRRDAVFSDVAAALRDVRIGDERIDVTRAERVLDTVACVPGGILNVNKLAGEIGMSRATIESYLSHLERRFLVHRLMNLGARPRKQGTRSAAQKLYPVDVALPIAILRRMGHNVRTEPELFGGCLETFVVNEIIAQGDWSNLDLTTGFWRDATRGHAEVDLVLVDGRGRRVGVEVKSATTVHPRDAAGLRAMAEADGLSRGFVVYQGSEWVELDESVWALPIAAMWDPAAWPERSRSTRRKRMADPTNRNNDGPDEPRQFGAPPAASLFVSYVHADDEHEGGAILRLVARIASAYAAISGEELEVFRDRDIRWEEVWADRINAELRRTSLLLAVVTPRYLTSAACRSELTEFTTATAALGQPRLVLPLVWRRTPRLEEDSDDLVVQQLRRAQWVVVDELRFAEPDSIAYRRIVESLAERLHQTVETMARQPAATPIELGNVEMEQETLDELVVEGETAAESVVEGFNVLVTALNRFGEDLAAIAPGTSAQGWSARQARDWALEAGREITPSTEALDDAVSDLKKRWIALDRTTTAIVKRADSFVAASDQGLTDLFDVIAELGRQFDEILDDPQLVELGSTLRSVAATSRGFRPAAQAAQGSIALINEMRATITAWLGMRDARGGA